MSRPHPRAGSRPTCTAHAKSPCGGRLRREPFENEAHLGVRQFLIKWITLPTAPQFFELGHEAFGNERTLGVTTPPRQIVEGFRMGAVERPLPVMLPSVL